MKENRLRKPELRVGGTRFNEFITQKLLRCMDVLIRHGADAVISRSPGCQEPSVTDSSSEDGTEEI